MHRTSGFLFSGVGTFLCAFRCCFYILRLIFGNFGYLIGNHRFSVFACEVFIRVYEKNITHRRFVCFRCILQLGLFLHFRICFSFYSRFGILFGFL